MQVHDSNSIDRRYCHFALALGLKYYSHVFPNPPVGAIIVKNRKIISTGVHKKAGLAHAEVNAIGHAGTQAKGSDLYVSLEPCNHTGRTGPCTEAILQAGIKRVFYLLKDNTKAGGGAEYLRNQGVEVNWIEPEDQVSRYLDPWRSYVSDGKITFTPVFSSSLGGDAEETFPTFFKNSISKRTQSLYDRNTPISELTAYDVSYPIRSKNDSDYLLDLKSKGAVKVTNMIVVRKIKYFKNIDPSFPAFHINLFGDLSLNKVRFYKDICIEEYRVAHV